MFKFYNFHFKGKINEQAMSNNLIMKLQGCWGWGGVPAPFLEETLQKPSRPSPHPTVSPTPSGKGYGREAGLPGGGHQVSFAERQCRRPWNVVHPHLSNPPPQRPGGQLTQCLILQEPLWTPSERNHGEQGEEGDAFWL